MEAVSKEARGSQPSSIPQTECFNHVRFLQRLNAEGDTVVLITHDNAIAVKAKRIVRLQDGKIIYTGSMAGFTKGQSLEEVMILQEKEALHEKFAH